MRINDTLRYLNVGLPEDILKKKLYGDLEGTIQLIDRRLEDKDLPDALFHALTVQREIIRRTPIEYPYTKKEALAMVQELVPDFTMEELEKKMDDRAIRWIYLQGEIHIISDFLNTMLKADTAFAKRANQSLPGFESALNTETTEDPRDRCIRIMKEKGEMTTRIHIRASVKLHEEHFKKGMFLRVHLPIPAASLQQRDIVIENISPANGQLAPETSPARTVCWEEYAEENHEFYVEYSYTHKAVYHDTEQYLKDKKEVKQPIFYIEEEAPHIVFTPYIRHLAESLTTGATHPLEKAKKFYDFITLHMKYTFMPPYFLLEDIPENCAKSYTGDCGVFALLFITLCRCVGIPARWQSGLAAEPDFCGSHDWVQFYVAPYGWLYADPSYGVSATRLEKEERRAFYFGNLEPYRMVANHAFQQEFDIPKEQWRADPYDNQGGEMESDHKGFTFHEYERNHEVISVEEL